MDAPQIDLSACRRRQQRLLDVMHRRRLDYFVTNQHAHVQWLTGVRFAPALQCCCALGNDGRLTLIAPSKEPERVAADEVRTFPAKWHSTMRNDQALAAAQTLHEALRDARHGGWASCQWGIEYSTCGPHYTSWMGAAIHDLEPDLYQLRRRKETDEVELIRRAIRGTERMYEEARRTIEPRVCELELFNMLQATAVMEFGEMLTATGNDYQCGSRGGAPRPRRIIAGELYILDLGPAYRGYFADNARTIAVTDISDEQQTAWEYIQKSLDYVTLTVRPGVSCKELFQEVQAILDQSPYGVFNHHLGHGFGLYPHEAPHLNPYWDDRFEVGDIFTAEPGLYDADVLRGGIRIEHDYLVTENGVELLTPFPTTMQRD